MSPVLARIGGCVAAMLIGSGAAMAALPVTSGLTLDLNANIGVITTGNAVTTWQDQSGHAFNVTQNTASQQPTLVTNALNGNSVIRFDGNTTGSPPGINADYLQSSAQMSQYINGAGWTTFVVFKANTINRITNSGYDQNAVWGDAGGYVGMGLNKTGSPATNPVAGLHNWYGGSEGDIATSISTGTYQLLGGGLDSGTGGHTSGTLYLSLYGGGSDSIGGIGNITVLNNVLRVGGGYQTASNNANNNAFDGDIAELLIYNRTLTVQERTDVMNYLNTTWLPEPGSAGVILLGLCVGVGRRRGHRTSVSSKAKAV